MARPTAQACYVPPPSNTPEKLTPGCSWHTFACGHPEPDRRRVLQHRRCTRMAAGDTIGVLLNRAAATISFFKDGVDLGVAFDHVHEERLYPCVGMRTKDEEVRQYADKVVVSMVRLHNNWFVPLTARRGLLTEQYRHLASSNSTGSCYIAPGRWRPTSQGPSSRTSTPSGGRRRKTSSTRLRARRSKWRRRKGGGRCGGHDLSIEGSRMQDMSWREPCPPACSCSTCACAARVPVPAGEPRVRVSHAQWVFRHSRSGGAGRARRHGGGQHQRRGGGAAKTAGGTATSQLAP